MILILYTGSLRVLLLSIMDYLYCSCDTCINDGDNNGLCTSRYKALKTLFSTQTFFKCSKPGLLSGIKIRVDGENVYGAELLNKIKVGSIFILRSNCPVKQVEALLELYELKEIKTENLQAIGNFNSRAKRYFIVLDKSTITKAAVKMKC